MWKLLTPIIFCSLASVSNAELTEQRRGELLEFYPCGIELSDDELQYLADWANATKQDPCMLTTEEFLQFFSLAEG